MTKLIGTAFLVTALATSYAGAAPLSWDPSISGGPAGGGTASAATEWKTSGAGNVWWDDTNNVGWTNGNDATFAGTAGTVHLGSNVAAGNINFGTSGYTLNLKDFDFTGANDAYNLTATGLGGSAATITNTSGTSTRTFTLNNATDQTWSGTFNGSNRLTFVKQGAGTFNFSGTLWGNAWNALAIEGGTFRLNGPTFMAETGGVYASNNAKFDLNGNSVTVRILAADALTEVTSAAAATLTIQRNETSNVHGLLSGAGLAINYTRNGTLNLNNANTYGGGTTVALGSNQNIATVNVNNNSGLGTGSLTTSIGGGTSRIDINFTTATPTIGSLSGSGLGQGTHITLGSAGIDTTLTVNQSAAGNYAGTISNFAGQTGSLVKNGAEVLTLSGINTYTGNTTINAGGLTLANGGELRFDIEDGGVSNSILGVGTVTLNGLLRLDISSLTATVGTWNLVNAATLNESFGGTFGLAFLDNTTFSTGDNVVYTSGDWSFNTITGDLTLIPEPGSLALLGLGSLCLLGGRRRK